MLLQRRMISECVAFVVNKGCWSMAKKSVSSVQSEHFSIMLHGPDQKWVIFEFTLEVRLRQVEPERSDAGRSMSCPSLD